MKSFLSVCLITLIQLISGTSIYCQQNYAVNLKTDIMEDKMLITYDAPSRDAIPFYSVILIITYNGKTVQTNSIVGDFGNKIEPGTDKAITWYYPNDFKEDIKKVSVNVYAYKVSEPKVYFEIVSKSNNGFAPCEIKVSNSSANVNEYKWDFGDPGSGISNNSTEKEPGHIFEHGGQYTITLVGRNSLLSLESTSYQSLEIKEHEPAVADFSFTVTGSKPPYEVKFTNLSKNADILLWNFGDPGSGAKNNTSDKPNPSYKYKQAGTYTVVLTAKSTVSGFSDKVSKDVTLRAPLNPDAGFVFSLSQESAPAVVQFKNTSTNAGIFKWNFGDSDSENQNTSTETDPAHIYVKAGKYEVILIASNSSTGKSSKFSDFVTVSGPPKPPVAGFKIGNNNVIAPVTISFKNTSTDADYFSWDFGDTGSGSKNISNDNSPIHTYTSPGKYSVVLKAISSKTNETSLFTDYVNIIELVKQPLAKFSIENNNMTAPAVVKFKNISVNASDYSWDFGDPFSALNTSSESNPSHNYNKAGQFNVILVAKNISGVTNTFSDYVYLSEPAKSPVAGFTIENNNVTGPVVVRFTNTSSDATSYSWNFGDPASKTNTSTEKNGSHSYGKAGKYVVTLTARNNSGAVNTWSDNVIVLEAAKPPVAKFAIENNNVTNPATIRFTNTSSDATYYSWNFGDPTSSANTSSENNPSHNYVKAGKYLVTLTAKNNSGAVSTWSGDVIINEPEIFPQAKFTIENNNMISPVNVKFINSSSNAISYSWDFGDPSAGAANHSTDFDPTHTYNQPGRYQVILTVKNSSGTSRIFTDFVIVNELPKPLLAKFVIENNNVIGPATVSFSNASENAGVYQWNFGDPESGLKNISEDVNPVHTYYKPGNYHVRLKASDKLTGKTNETDMVVTIMERLLPPVAAFTYDFNGKYAPLDVVFTNKSENADTYKWIFGDSSSAGNESAGTSPVHHYEKPGKYTVTLEAKSSKTGKTQVASKEIIINEKYNTYLKTFGKKNSNEIATCLLSLQNGQYIALINEQEAGATIVTFDKEGTKFVEKKTDKSIYDIIVRPDNKGYIFAGIDYPNDLFIQSADKQLNPGNPVIVYSNVSDPGYRLISLHTALSGKNELGLIGNLVSDDGGYNIWFQKVDADGKPVVAKGKTFKYVGFKVANQIIPTGEGDFAVTGGYQQDKNSEKDMILGIISEDGTGKMSIMKSKQNITGNDIIELPNGNFEILIARESPDNPDFSEISLKLVDRDNNPMNCAIDLLGQMRTSDLKMFPPRILPVKDGYILLSHIFNGIDSDIALLWIDKSGSVLLRKEEIKRPGDQFGTGLMQESDGSLIITGTERIQGDYDAIIIKTDPQGRYTDSSDMTGK